MKYVKYTLLAIVILVALPFVVAAFIPQSLVIERTVTIRRPVAEVFDYLRPLRNQVEYSAWFKKDPKVEISYRGEDGTVGAAMAWKSAMPEVGVGEQEIKAITPGERIDHELRFQEPFVSTDSTYITTAATGDGQTTVRLVYQGKLPYPANLFCFYVSEMVGKEMQTSLENLKGVLEK